MQITLELGPREDKAIILFKSHSLIYLGATITIERKEAYWVATCENGRLIANNFKKAILNHYICNISKISSNFIPFTADLCLHLKLKLLFNA